MPRLIWGSPADRLYDQGVDQGVLYPPDGRGVAWNGLISVEESPSDSDDRSGYQDGVKVRVRNRPGEFAGTINAITYPDSFYENVLTPRRPRRFGMSYRVQNGDSYKIHLVYNVLLDPSSKNHQQADISTFSWAFTTLPVPVVDSRPTAHLVIDARTAYPRTIEALEAILYGSDVAEASLPSPEDVMQVFEINSIIQIIDNGDGTWTAIGPDDLISMTDATTFQITTPAASYLDADTYTIHSL